MLERVLSRLREEVLPDELISYLTDMELVSYDRILDFISDLIIDDPEILDALNKALEYGDL